MHNLKLLTTCTSNNVLKSLHFQLRLHIDIILILPVNYYLSREIYLLSHKNTFSGYEDHNMLKNVKNIF